MTKRPPLRPGATRRDYPKRSTKPIAKSTKRRTWKRKPSEFNRIYGSKARASWVTSLPCIYCVSLHPMFLLVTGRSENAHTVTGGTGRKADADTIVPLCHAHHVRYDRHLRPFDDEATREWVKAQAVATEAKWQAYCAAGAGE